MLRKKFAGKPEHVVNYLFLLAEEVDPYVYHLQMHISNSFTWVYLSANAIRRAKIK